VSKSSQVRSTSSAIIQVSAKGDAGYQAIGLVSVGNRKILRAVFLVKENVSPA